MVTAGTVTFVGFELAGRLRAEELLDFVAVVEVADVDPPPPFSDR
jgi:hypothetical protein